MAFGIYIHIPHCLQVCPYCDFTKYELGKILPPKDYVDLILEEIRTRSDDIGPRDLQTLYFGGGTPSLLEPNLMLALLTELANHGFRLRTDAEFTIEVNPGTIDEAKLDAFLALGANRFSVGAQTFNSRLLSLAGRKHTVEHTHDTLALLKSKRANFTLDLLFALPTQTIAELEADIDRALAFGPAHVSTYYLTVPPHHPMAAGRASDDEQAAMFELLEFRLQQAGYNRYEISSYAKPGFESRHNRLYWTDEEYWGLGVSAHSFLKRGPWGLRFWNPTALPAYQKQIRGQSGPFTIETSLPSAQREPLQKHEALTDFCHVRLRMIQGMDENALRLKFGENQSREVILRLRELASRGLVEFTTPYWRLSPRGRLLTNLVFADLTFLSEDLVAH